MVQVLSIQKVKDIKNRIWEGVPQAYIAMEFDVAQATVSRITNGHIWFEVPWPDGQHGPMPVSRRLELHQGRLEKDFIKRPVAIIKQGEISDIAKQAAVLVQEQMISDLEKETESLPTVAEGYVPDREEEQVDLSFKPDVWNHLKGKMPNNPYIKKAEESGSDLEKNAVLRTFLAENIPSFESPQMQLYINKTKEMLEKQDK